MIVENFAAIGVGSSPSTNRYIQCFARTAVSSAGADDREAHDEEMFVSVVKIIRITGPMEVGARGAAGTSGHVLVAEDTVRAASGQARNRKRSAASSPGWKRSQPGPGGRAEWAGKPGEPQAERWAETRAEQRQICSTKRGPD